MEQNKIQKSPRPLYLRSDVTTAYKEFAKAIFIDSASPHPVSPRLNRIAVGLMFFMHGLCFASWASRIPTIQDSLKLSASSLGGVLFALPVGFFISLPLAGWLVNAFGSRRVVIIASMFYSAALIFIGISSTTVALVLSLLAFGLTSNLLNIAINTQAVSVERLYSKRLMASFHGLWSLAGFVGAAFGAWMIAQSTAPAIHYAMISALFLLLTVSCSRFLVVTDDVNKEKRPVFAIPDKPLVGLGIIAFCSMMIEGAMFDWSGIYFIETVKVDTKLTGVGYSTFMIAMAAMRFLADGISGRYGLQKILQFSGVLTTVGLLLAVLFPSLLPAILGFFFIGLGVSSVVPMVYSAAGKSNTLSPGTALTAVSSLGFMGLLIGPPLIGLLAEATSLRISFLAITTMSIAVVVLSSLIPSKTGSD
ncbi:MFS transporter [Algoriphagus resistens]|uniref:MFS transporter n=1 Tax=Algoriphagus resistens TaxID=1750590 RepID=UPI0009E97056|nr:MFS transporter [Algoriphagus resistens]